MKKLIYLLAALALPIAAVADSFTGLWKQYREAQQKDLPQTEISILSKISTKAAREKSYGHLLKANLLRASAQVDISPDSADVEEARLEKDAAAAKDPALKAVYAATLGRLCQERSVKAGDEYDRRSKEWFAKALADPAMLAASPSTAYSPAIVNGTDSKVFGDDLLHVIAMEADDYRTLYRYYSASGNRTAACLCALKSLQQTRPANIRIAKKSRYLQRVDSLITAYGDLTEAGELAIEHYSVMERAEDVTTEEKVNFINYALSRWGAWPRMNILRNALSDLQQPSFNINIGDGMLLPNVPRRMQINSIRNIPEITLTVQRVNVDGNTDIDPSTKSGYARLQRLLVPGTVQTVTRRYPGLPAWQESTDTIVLQGMPVGVYLVEATTSVSGIDPQRQLLRVSNVFVMRQGLPDKRIRFAVVNATTGEPLQGAHIQLTYNARAYNKTSESHTTITTDKNGEVDYTYDKAMPDRVWAYTDNDRACQETGAWASFSYNAESPKHQDVQLFTDRAIYRPGQTVHIAALAWEANNDSQTSKPMANTTIDLELFDANNRSIGKQTATTDEFGSAATDFVLPQSGLTGNFYVRANINGTYGFANFSVEQYKRPTFQVSFDKYEQSYQPGDTITLRGVATTYSGVPVQGAKVAYTVNRRQGVWWHFRPTQNAEVESDSTVTADDGSFTISVPMLFPEDAPAGKAAYYYFSVNARVTDLSGETHEGAASLPLSNRKGLLTSDLPEKALQDSLRSITFTYKNLAGEAVDGTVRYRLDNGDWLTTKTGTATAVKHKYSSGKHLLEAVCGNDTLRQSMVVFSLSDKRPAVETHDWFYLSANQFPSDGGPVYIQAGASDEGPLSYYTIMSGDRVLARGTRQINNSVYTRKLNYKKEYGDGLTITLAWVVRGKLYTHTATITRPLPDNRLQTKWTTFRDRLTPGQKETWTMHVTAPNGKPAKAQLIAAMYDKSLDDIKAHSWTFTNNYSLTTPYSTWRGGSDNAIGLYGFQPYTSLRERQLAFSHLDTDMFGWWTEPYDQMFGTVLLAGGPRMYKGAKLTRVAATPDAVELMSEAVATNDAVAPMQASSEEPKESATSPSVRENLNETAFFQPALTTDQQGNVNITFTLPESATTWHFLGLAHDKALNFATVDAEAVASKAVMVQPNMPRFLREGDQATLTARIFNTTAQRQSGTARLQIIDPETDKVLMEASEPFAVDANGTATASFNVNTNELAARAKGQTLFTARVYAEGKGFSDGEQHYLPLLPNKEQVINTIPFTQNGAGKKSVDLTALFPNGATDKRLTVEYTNNPAWLVVQALPTIANPWQDNAISLAAAIYANTIGRAIMTSSPKMAETIKLWQQETGAETSLTSNLEKNQELKTLILSETPWVAEAGRETEQKRQLASFLDSSTMDYRISSFTEKLKKLQNADGSFSWWPDMEGNTCMTMAVTKILTRLNTLAGAQEATADLLDNAFAFMDRQMAKEVAELKQEEKKGAKSLCPSETACDYLYASALAGRKQTADITYLVNLLDKQPTSLTIYGKASSALILAQYGKTAHAKTLLQSLREYTVYKEETGRYFDTRKALYSWFDYRIPSQVAAIEALKRLAPKDTATITDMQRWLLAEKRTTAWETPLNAVDAAYAFLTGNDGSVDFSKLASQEQTTLALDGKPVALPRATAAIGYVKTTMTDNAQTAARTLTADKTSTGTSWGAVYGQFMQTATDIADAASGITVKREVIANNAQALHVGDKVTVRLTITADRDYDFVQVQDKRAACLEPVSQLSGYRWGYYIAPQDNATNYYFSMLSKGKHVVETQYYVDREGDYQSGTCTAQCAYAPEYSGRTAAVKLNVR